MLLPDRLDTTIAHKAINLMTELSSAEKAVAGAIIDHFNRKTGQCDPGVDRLSSLLDLSRRTVLRAIDRLHDLELILKVRHGGRSNRNDYQPAWSRFREMDADWSQRFKGARPLPASDLSAQPRQDGHFPGVVDGTQTRLKNQFNELSLADETVSIVSPTSRSLTPTSGQARRERALPRRRPLSSAEAAPTEAERRWTRAVHKEFCTSPDAYGAVIEAIGPELRAAATAAEMQQRGAGLRTILDHVRGVGGIRTPALRSGER